MTPTAMTLLLTLAAANGQPPLVRYATKVFTKSWEPLELAAVEKAIEASALEPLTASGGMRLERSPLADIRKGEYALTIYGRFIEEAERFSVYISFAPGSRDDLPSFSAIDTSDALGRKKRSEMERRIRATAARAGKRMAEVLAPQLQSVRLRVDPPPIEDPALPQEWGPIEVPEIKSKSSAIKRLLNVRNERHVRHKALAEIKGYVFDQQAARNAVERCVLRDPSSKLRADCVRALAPVARNHVPTQRVLLHAMRNEVYEDVLAELVEVSGTFVGLSRLETIATWLELIAQDGTPARGAQKVARLLGEEERVPNLDFAVAACLQQQALVSGKKEECARTLLGELPPPRRRAVAWRFLSDVQELGCQNRRAFEAVVDRAFSRDKASPPPELPELLFRIAEAPSARRCRHKAFALLRKHAPATPRTMERLVALSQEQAAVTDALRVIEGVARRAPDLAPMVEEALRRTRGQVRFLPKPARTNPYEAMDKTIDRLSRQSKRTRR